MKPEVTTGVIVVVVPKHKLFFEGIVVGPGKDKYNEELLIMRMATPDDVLPESLAKFLEPIEDDMPEPGIEES